MKSIAILINKFFIISLIILSFSAFSICQSSEPEGDDGNSDYLPDNNDDDNNNNNLDPNDQTVSAMGLPVQIPESVLSNTAVVEISGMNDTINDVNATISISHNKISEVEIYLKSPTGTILTLSAGNGGSGADYANTVFDDAASVNITDGSPPFTGSYIPEELMENLNGENPNGTWSLRVVDTVVGNGTGTLNSFTLNVVTGTLSPKCVSKGDPNCLHLASFNLKQFNDSSLETKKTGIADIIKSNFDLVGLQEMDPAAITSWTADYLGAEWTYKIGTTTVPGDIQVAVVYKSNLFNLTDSGDLDSVKSDGIIDDSLYPWSSYRLPFYAKVTISETSEFFHLLVLHLNAFSDSSDCTRRQNQVEDVNAWLITQSGPFIIMGDFNDEIDGTGNCSSTDTLAAFESNTNLRFISQQPEYMDEDVVTHIGYSSTIDHIMVTDDIFSSVYDLSTVTELGFTRSSIFADVVSHADTDISDHQPVYMWLEK
jgi:subtilisin-like proprotein convertase family protein